jgi:hypothetical protein
MITEKMYLFNEFTIPEETARVTTEPGELPMRGAELILKKIIRNNPSYCRELGGGSGKSIGKVREVALF